MRITVFLACACLMLASTMAVGQINTDTGACCDSSTGDCTEDLTVALCEQMCTDNPALIWAVGLPEVCNQFAGNQVDCEAAFILGFGGPASCWYDAVGGGCDECDPSSEQSGLCVNSCGTPEPPVCDGDPSLIFAAGSFQVCRQFDGNQADCETAYHADQDGNAASCWYDAAGDQGSGTDVCLGCGPNNEQNGLCVNSCGPPEPPTCDGDPSLILASGTFQVCQQFNGNQADCETAYHIDGSGNAASCWYDVAGIAGHGSDACLGCGPNNEQGGFCVNVCGPPVTCDGRTLAVGGSKFGPCPQFDGDQGACEAAFALDFDGEPYSCWYDGFSCRGCGSSDAQQGLCYDECDGNTTQWSAGQSCDEVDCVAGEVPAVSPRGLVVLALLFLATVAVLIGYRYRALPE